MPRRTRRTARKGGRKTPRSFAVIPFAAKFNAIIQVIEPYLQRFPALIAAAQSKNLAGFLQTMREANKELVSVANLIQAAGPLVGLAVLRYVRRYAPVPNPKLGPIRAF